MRMATWTSAGTRFRPSTGPPPEIRISKTEAEVRDAVAAWLSERSKAGVAPQEIGVFVRSIAEIPRARAAVEKNGLRQGAGRRRCNGRCRLHQHHAPRQES